MTNLFSELGKLAAAEHVLVTGPSGAGKSTLAGQLSEELKLPVFSLDKYPALKAYTQGPEFQQTRLENNKTTWLGNTQPRYRELRREAVEHALGLPEPHIIEGTQIADNPELAKAYRTIAVMPTQLQLVRQRLGRDRKKGKYGPIPPGSALARSRAEIARMLYQELKPSIDKLMANGNVESMRPRLSKTAATYYHGTSPDLIDTILKDGLDPSKAGTGGGTLPGLDEKDPRKKLFLTTYPGYADFYARMAAKSMAKRQAKAAGKGWLARLFASAPPAKALRIDLPDDYPVTRLAGGMGMGDEWYVTDKISPAHIKLND